MLVVNRFLVGTAAADERDATAADGRDAAAADPADAVFAARAREALAAFAACPGFTDGQVGRSADDPARWCLVTRWESVGAYRRALGTFGVKVAATPLLAEAIEEPSAYEVLAATRDGEIHQAASDRSTPGGR